MRFELSPEAAGSIAATIKAVAGVADLSAGRFGQVLLRFPGQTVTGLQFLGPKSDTELAAHVIVDVDALGARGSLQQLAGAVRDAAFAACPQLERLDVVFADAVTGAAGERGGNDTPGTSGASGTTATA